MTDLVTEFSPQFRNPWMKCDYNFSIPCCLARRIFVFPDIHRNLY